jgi:hypothetical protein
MTEPREELESSAKVAPEAIAHICECGAALTHPKTGRRRSTCSTACRRRRQNRKRWVRAIVRLEDAMDDLIGLVARVAPKLAHEQRAVLSALREYSARVG